MQLGGVINWRTIWWPVLRVALAVIAWTLVGLLRPRRRAKAVEFAPASNTMVATGAGSREERL